MPGKRNEYEEGSGNDESACSYDPPRIIFEKRVEAVATTCEFDPPLTKSSVGEGCTGMTFS